MSDADSIVSIARDHARNFPDKPFVVFWRTDHQSTLTFGGLVARATAIAASLKSSGVGRGDLVIISHETGPDLYAAFLGAMMIGAPPAIMPYPNPKQNDAVYWSTHRALFSAIEPAHYLFSDKIADLYDQNLSQVGERSTRLSHIQSVPEGPTSEPIDPASVAFLQHSSGTTALKKGVMLSHGKVVDHVRAYAAAIGLTRDSEIASWLPLYHDMGLIACFMTPLIMGATVTSIDPFEWVARPRLWLDAVRERRAEYAWMPNFALAHLANAIRSPGDFDISSIRALMNCSEPCQATTHERFTAHFAASGFRAEAMQVCYAMAENVFAVSQTRPGFAARLLDVDRAGLERDQVVKPPETEAGDTRRLVSCGNPLPGIKIRIVDEDRQPVPDGVVGEISIESGTLFEGYNRNPALSAKVMAGGRYFTSDMGFLKDGELFVTGRRDDMILAYGRNFMAHELEAVANAVDGVKPGRAVVFGITSEQIGTAEIVVLVEMLEGVTDPARVAKALRQRFEAEAGVAPRHVEALTSGALLKTTSGKISRSANRNAFLARRSASTARNHEVIS